MITPTDSQGPPKLADSLVFSMQPGNYHYRYATSKVCTDFYQGPVGALVDAHVTSYRLIMCLSKITTFLSAFKAVLCLLYVGNLDFDEMF